MIRPVLRLLRPKLALLNGVAAASGSLLVPGIPEAKLIFAAFCGVTFLAAGGSALNQALEMNLDSLMMRTRLRPLPQRQLTPAVAVLIGVIIIVIALAQIAAFGGLLPVMLGVIALVWYLAVYTPLKRRTPFALAIGGLCGALPPVIGWTIAGGDPADFRIVLLAGLLYLWQVPHFWLLLSRHEADYRIAGIELPGSSERWGYFMAVWIIALAAAAMMLPTFGIIERHAGLWYLLLSLPLIVMAVVRAENALFYCFNSFPLLLAIMLCIQKY